jgi:hypothetical protein
MTPSLEKTRSHHAKTLQELRPIVQNLEKASRDALNPWKVLTMPL